MVLQGNSTIYRTYNTDFFFYLFNTVLGKF